MFWVWVFLYFVTYITTFDEGNNKKNKDNLKNYIALFKTLTLPLLEKAHCKTAS